MDHVHVGEEQQVQVDQVQVDEVQVHEMQVEQEDPHLGHQLQVRELQKVRKLELENQVRELEKVLEVYPDALREARMVHEVSLSHHLAIHSHRNTGGRLQSPGEIPSTYTSYFYLGDCHHIARTKCTHSATLII